MYNKYRKRNSALLVISKIQPNTTTFQLGCYINKQQHAIEHVGKLKPLRLNDTDTMGNKSDSSKEYN